MVLAMTPSEQSCTNYDLELDASGRIIGGEVVYW